VSPDVRVFVYAFLLSVLTGLIFGLVPALQASKPNVIAALKDEQLWFGAGRRRFSPETFSWSRKLLFLCSC
jgi:hypothetical protein